MDDVEDHVVFFSGGIGSYGAAKRVVERYGTEDVTLLFTDTKIEDDDLYRFLDEAAEDVGAKLVKIADGRTPWEIFKDVKMLGNTMYDPCSRILKRELSRDWLREHKDPDNTVIYIGMDWTEDHRFQRAKKAWGENWGWKMDAPLIWDPPVDKQQIFEWLEEAGIKKPRLYELGFPHNNCGGACVKAGHGHFKHLLLTLPEVYAEWERKEQEVMEEIDTERTILRDRRGGTTSPMSLRKFRERVMNEEEIDEDSWGGCGCFVDFGEDELDTS